MPARLAGVLTVAALAAVAAGCGSSSSAKQATTTTPPLLVMNARLCPELAARNASACSAGAGANRVRAGAFASRCPSALYR